MIYERKLIDCECSDREHILAVSYDKELELVSFNFILYPHPDPLNYFCKRIWWRIKTACKILFSTIKIEEEWLIQKERLEKELLTYLQQ